jgi:hypothetical protein
MNNSLKVATMPDILPQPAGATEHPNSIPLADHLQQDPAKDREAEKYDNPVPSREYIMALLEKVGKPMFTDEIQKALGVDDEERLEGVRRRLKAMVRDGQLLQNRRGAFGLVHRMDLIRGRIHAHPDGFGFLVPDVGGEDLFLPFREMQRVMHGDIVLAHVVDVDHRGRKIGAIVDVVERAHVQVVGKLFFEHSMAYVRSENKRITQDVLIPSDALSGAIEGQLVVAEIIHPPTPRSSAVGKITQVLGDVMAITTRHEQHRCRHGFDSRSRITSDCRRPHDHCRLFTLDAFTGNLGRFYAHCAFGGDDCPTRQLDRSLLDDACSHSRILRHAQTNAITI